MAATAPLLTLRTVDGVDITLSRDAARLSGLLREWIFETADPPALPVPVHSAVLRRVVDWLEHHRHDLTTIARGAPEQVVMERCSARLALRVAEGGSFALNLNHHHPCVVLRVAGDGRQPRPTHPTDGRDEETKKAKKAKKTKTEEGEADATPFVELPVPPVDVAVECHVSPAELTLTHLHLTARWRRALTPAESEAVRRALGAPRAEVVFLAANHLPRPLPEGARCDALLQDPFDIELLRAFPRIGLHAGASEPTLAALIRAASHLRVGTLMHMATAKWAESIRGLDPNALRVLHGFATKEEEEDADTRKGGDDACEEPPPRTLFYGVAS